MTNQTFTEIIFKEWSKEDIEKSKDTNITKQDKMYLEKIMKTKEYQEVIETKIGDKKCLYWYSLLDHESKEQLRFKNSRISISWVLRVFGEDEYKGLEEHVMYSFKGINAKDILQSAILAFLLQDRRIKW